MRWPLLTSLIEQEDDVIAVRQRARSLGERLGFGLQDQTRIATAVSEIARNAFGYAGGGKVEYGVDDGKEGQSLAVKISDAGPGIPELDAVLEGRYRSTTGLGMGITGSRRLMDRFEIASTVGRGTVVTFGKLLPKGSKTFTGADLAAMADALARTRLADPNAAMREQNRELLRSLAELAEREEEAHRLNAELAETNRGVVALYAELEAQAVQLREAGANLESQVAARTAELAQANERLRAEAIERERMENDLRQSQKMEAVGQLTGGIAHDFNNLLTGIVGSLDLLQSRMAKGRKENLGRYVETAMASANRAAALTHRLLAFARRQPLDPKPTDANALILGMSDLLRRTISEAIALRTETEHDLWPTLCDPHQLENAILNLAINARDAMPSGGSLTIRTRNGRLSETTAEPKPGEMPDEYVCISVTDTGTGMPPDVIARAFDPFFTTKPLGQGTGLGLSMIYGFAKQSEGHARIESEVGVGTTIGIYLPRHHGAGAEEAALLEVHEMQRGDGETVLVVEDEQVVRDLVVEVLHDLGYRTLQAVDGPGGLRLLQTSAKVDLLVTDVGLPGLNGRQLADQARETRPDLKVLFITGYAEGAVTPTGFLDAGMAMITKPFAVETLATRVSAMIGEEG
ncbi:ATP-binding protein [Methylobacterium iners]|uniref:histidine kinase n=1 Tax=Methylobacterium iners TaxID=418707 RepID=A0ABQ4RUL7_9HYPH|nr:Sensor histidine kinase RcsC [Methylobacterium iners]